jgi:outer membrane protein TolC
MIRAACVAFLASGLVVAPSRALTLEDAIAQALSENELARSADERARAAEARVGVARGFLLPDLTATSDYTRRSHETRRTDAQGTTTLQSRDATESRLTLEQTVFDAQAWPLLLQARRARDAARYAALDARRQLAFETAQAFLAALSSEQIARAAAERLDLAQRNHSEVRVRFDAQLVGSNDVTRAELEAASA